MKLDVPTAKGHQETVSFRNANKPEGQVRTCPFLFLSSIYLSSKIRDDHASWSYRREHWHKPVWRTVQPRFLDSKQKRLALRLCPVDSSICGLFATLFLNRALFSTFYGLFCQKTGGRGYRIYFHHTSRNDYKIPAGIQNDLH